MTPLHRGVLFLISLKPALSVFFLDAETHFFGDFFYGFASSEPNPSPKILPYVFVEQEFLLWEFRLQPSSFC